MAVDLNPPRGARRGALAALVVLVVAVHAWVTGEVAGSLRDASDAAAMPTRIEVAYVREMQPSLPPESFRIVLDGVQRELDAVRWAQLVRSLGLPQAAASVPW